MSIRSAVDAVTESFGRIAADGRDGIWITLVERETALGAAQRVDELRSSGAHLPLAGSTLAVKDNIDVAGLPTTAGCPAYSYNPSADAPAVAALTAAGAVVIGKTNLDQFATGLVGVRSPYGITPNAHWDGLISGGSSSGSAVAVATGMVDVALGTDTAGSGRVPAACNAIVGVKPTRGRISTRGVVPACRSLDCVSVFARSVDAAAAAVDLASGHDPADPWSRVAQMAQQPGRPLRVGVPVGSAFDGVELVAADAELVDVDLAPFLEAGALLYDGSFVAERYEAVGEFVDANPDAVDPVVGAIIAAAGQLRAWQVFRDRTELARLSAATARVWELVDVVIAPTVPRVPTIAEVLADPIAVNTMLGTYTNFVNLLDLCAVTLPVGENTGAGPAPSVTLIGPAWTDEVLVSLARRLDTPANRRSA